MATVEEYARFMQGVNGQDYVCKGVYVRDLEDEALWDEAADLATHLAHELMSYYEEQGYDVSDEDIIEVEGVGVFFKFRRVIDREI